MLIIQMYLLVDGRPLNCQNAPGPPHPIPHRQRPVDILARSSSYFSPNPKIQRSRCMYLSNELVLSDKFELAKK